VIVIKRRKNTRRDRVTTTTFSDRKSIVIKRGYHRYGGRSVSYVLKYEIKRVIFNSGVSRTELLVSDRWRNVKIESTVLSTLSYSVRTTRPVRRVVSIASPFVFRSSFLLFFSRRKTPGFERNTKIPVAPYRLDWISGPPRTSRKKPSDENVLEAAAAAAAGKVARVSDNGTFVVVSSA